MAPQLFSVLCRVFYPPQSGTATPQLRGCSWVTSVASHNILARAQRLSNWLSLA
ncbi:hypothetical protein HMPREF1978_00776 [Actinomyces graevenitzii F0530]|uniref:Uncharacterized protein n=1 Tax=Actinomyces graevenitzii F0530 TaxID=1321817 RepID=U1RFB6_9ACTO|nr:hypothetical protein HMPREF1978_00776 [Actinomyces graevenitzii F0530]